MEKTEILYAPVKELFLDARNPRLGRRNVEKGLRQSDVLELMRDWTLEELAVSFLESGFWPQEALIAVKEKVGKKDELVVVGTRAAPGRSSLRDHPVSRQRLFSPSYLDTAANRSSSTSLRMISTTR